MPEIGYGGFIFYRCVAVSVVTVDECGFEELANELGITPKETVDIILSQMKNIPYAMRRYAKNRSLDESLRTLLDCSEATYAWEEELKEIVGNRRHVVSEADIDLRKHVIRYYIDYPQGDDSEINHIELYFGDNSGEVVNASMDIELKGGKLSDEVLQEITDKIDGTVPDNDYPCDFEYSYDDGDLSFYITVHTDSGSREFKFDMPKFNDMNNLIIKIKEIIRAHA